MKKIWFFVEGESEEHFITHLIRNHLYEKFRLEKDLLLFITGDSRENFHHAVYCENCHSVDKIPHRINEMYYLVEKSGSDTVFVVCDIEKLKCNGNRKLNIESKLEAEVKKGHIRYVFFNPMIEVSYWDCPQVVEKIIQLECRKKFGSRKVPGIALPAKPSHFQDELKKLFKRYNLKYRETIFSGLFFPRVDYEACGNPVLKRLLEFLEAVKV